MRSRSGISVGVSAASLSQNLIASRIISSASAFVAPQDLAALERWTPNVEAALVRLHEDLKLTR